MKHSLFSPIMASIPIITYVGLSLEHGSPNILSKFVVPKCEPSWTTVTSSCLMPMFILTRNLLASGQLWTSYIVSVLFLSFPLTDSVFRRTFYGFMMNTLICRLERMQQKPQSSSEKHFQIQNMTTAHGFVI